MASHNAPPLERAQNTNDCLTYQRDASVALVASTGDDQHLFCALDLLLSQPGFGSGRGVCGRG